MKKYYIPTSSQNFNNILSTESISPKVFYERRGFGIERWTLIPENNQESITLLYDAPHNFTHYVEGLDVYPLLIEIESNKDFQELSEGVFFTDKTIYLEPWHTKFYFFSDAAKKAVISLSDHSSEVKTFRLYKKSMQVKQFDGSYVILQKKADVRPENTDKYLEEDRLIDKMKGLLYGYYIGANRSVSKEQLEKQSVLGEIKNIFLSVQANLERTPSEVQRKRLEELEILYLTQKKEYKELESICRDKQIFTYAKFPELMLQLIRQGDEVRKLLQLKDIDSLLRDLRADDTSGRSIEYIEDEISKIKEEYIQERLMPEANEIVISPDGKIISLKSIRDSQMNELFKQWVNTVLCSKEFNREISVHKSKIAEEITKKAKEQLRRDWEGSSVRTELNNLRKYLGGNKFEHEWGNDLLSSMAAVLAKGDDWKKLLDFMQVKGMNNYRLAYAIYGVLTGFAEMTNDFTDLILNDKSDYLGEVYCEFHRQLHQCEIPKDSKASTSLTETIQAPVKFPQKSMDDWCNKIRTSAEVIIKHSNNMDRKKMMLKSLNSALEANGDNRDYNKFFDNLSKDEGWRNKDGKESRVLEKIMKICKEQQILPDATMESNNNTKKKPEERILISPEETNNVNDQQSLTNSYVAKPSIQKNTFPDEVTLNSPTPNNTRKKSILDEAHTWIPKCCDLYAKGPGAKQQLKKDLEWLVQDEKSKRAKLKNGATGKEQDCERDESNRSVKNHLKNFLFDCKKGGGQKKEQIKKTYNDVDIDGILNYINGEYDN